MGVRKLSRFMSPGLKRAGRRLTASLLAKAFDIPHPWFDLIRLAESVRPQALLDIGAHVGEMAIEMARSLPSVPVHAFEPSPDSFKRCKANLQRHRNACAHNIALGANQGSAVFHLNANEQTNSLLDNGLGNRRHLGKATQHVGETEVRVETLDGWLAEHAISGSIVMKVDVQGAESLLLAGGREAFHRQVRAVLFEVEYESMYAGSELFLEFASALRSQFGLQIAQVYPAKRIRGVAAWGDVLFIREAEIGSRQGG